MFPQPADEKLVARTLAGDRHAYRILMERYYRIVFRLCRSILRHAEDAEDATQEVFVRAFQSLGQFAGRGAFGGWLRRLTVNHCLNRTQTVSARVAAKSYSLDTLTESLQTSREADPEEQLLRSEEQKRIHDELDLLPPQQRVALALRLLEGLTYEEIADIMGVPVNSVRSWLHRGRTRLREALQEVVEC
ncbi:MAG: RNA polymerase sigma factor [Armatimonadetes bacterium]|nr:RNA polymerase sigma factor [Armatimonadota bacterium]